MVGEPCRYRAGTKGVLPGCCSSQPISVRGTYLTSPEIIEHVGKDAVRTKDPAGLILTTAALEKAKALLEREDRDDLRLRVAVQPGGCSGLRYELFFDDRLFDGDQVIRFSDAEEPVPELGSDEVGSDDDSGYGSGSGE